MSISTARRTWTILGSNWLRLCSRRNPPYENAVRQESATACQDIGWEMAPWIWNWRGGQVAESARIAESRHGPQGGRNYVDGPNPNASAKRLSPCAQFSRSCRNRTKSCEDATQAKNNSAEGNERPREKETIDESDISKSRHRHPFPTRSPGIDVSNPYSFIRRVE